MIRAVPLLAASTTIAFAVTTVVIGQPRAAGSPAAIIEEISGVKNLDRLELLAAGEEIDLGESGRIVLGYLRSCWQDTITGGRIVVTAYQSRVNGGNLLRRRVECDSAALAQAKTKAPLTPRAVVPLGDDDLPKPDIVLFGRGPVVLSTGADRLVTIDRLDEPSPSLRMELVNGRIDLVDAGVDLKAKGLYRFSTNGASIVVRIDELAEPGSAPVVGRFLVFQ